MDFHFIQCNTIIFLIYFSEKWEPLQAVCLLTSVSIYQKP